MTLKQYLQNLKMYEANVTNIQNIVSHFLYGTSPKTLAFLSKKGIVYNPPGHG